MNESCVKDKTHVEHSTSTCTTATSRLQNSRSSNCSKTLCFHKAMKLTLIDKFAVSVCKLPCLLIGIVWQFQDKKVPGTMQWTLLCSDNRLYKWCLCCESHAHQAAGTYQHPCSSLLPSHLILAHNPLHVFLLSNHIFMRSQTLSRVIAAEREISDNIVCFTIRTATGDVTYTYTLAITRI